MINTSVYLMFPMGWKLHTSNTFEDVRKNNKKSAGG
jgi:hypothetical protein